MTTTLFQAETTAMEKAIAWLKENADWRRVLLIYDWKSLIDTVNNSHAAEEDKRLLLAVTIRLTVGRRFEV